MMMPLPPGASGTSRSAAAAEDVLRESALADLGTLKAKIAPAPATATPFVRSGDRAGRLTFLGITAAGKARCKCDCGAEEDFAPGLIGEPLKPMNRRRLPRRVFLRCQACQATATAMQEKLTA